MPPSQLKQLKASLHLHNLLGPSRSKKQRAQASRNPRARLERTAALESVREQFNPFETKTPARRAKHDVVTNKDPKAKAKVGRPGVTRGLGEERRRATLLKEIQSRNKVGGIVDRRFGEDDPEMAPEVRMAERFARMSERNARRGEVFNLEDDGNDGLGEEVGLTHGGRGLFEGEKVIDGGLAVRDDFEEDLSDKYDEEEDFALGNEPPAKRMRLEEPRADDEEPDDNMPQRKKTKNEVMKEVIAKSKAYKAERQAAKEDDDDLRMELDKGMSDMYAALRSYKAPEKSLPSPPTDTEPIMDPTRAAMLAGKSREDAEKEYEDNIRQMKLDARSAPTLRTKTDEERAAEQAVKLQELERKRIRRMKGDPASSDDDDAEQPHDDGQDEVEQDDAEAFGLRLPTATEPRPELDVEDEDQFVLDDDLVASGSDADLASDEDDSGEESEQIEDDGDDDFINGLVLPKNPNVVVDTKQQPSKNLAYTYPCPQNHEELLELLKDKKDADIPTIVQRIRALYHKSLAAENEAKLGQFASVLVEHIVHMIDHGDGMNVRVPYDVVETLIRHLHSMAKSQPNHVASAFRAHLQQISENRPLQLKISDCIILTAIGTIFPTSDAFHPVTTPAMLTIGRYLGQSTIDGLGELSLGVYCCSLALRYQSLARRYVPEVISYLVNAIAMLAPKPLPEEMTVEPLIGQSINVPIRPPERRWGILDGKKSFVSEKINLATFQTRLDMKRDLASTLLKSLVHLSAAAGDLWSTKSSYPELITPLIHAIHHICTLPKELPSTIIHIAKTTLAALLSTYNISVSTRKPLLLHNHRPLAIKTSLPLFIDNYNPDRHYDPDRERAELSKLRAEHKKERKGAMRELRKDANFIAREKLMEKKEKDEAYDKKLKRLVAEIQGEEGREGKEYEREKRKRKRGRF